MTLNPYKRLYRRSFRFRRFVRRLKNGVVVRLTRALLAYIERRPLDEALALGDRWGARAFRWLRRPRSLALRHLDIAFGRSLPPSAREHLARASFINAARSFCEIARIDEIRARRDRYFEVEGFEHAQAVLARGTGAIVVTGHVGNWELLAAWWAWQGLPVVAIARKLSDPALNDLLVGLRHRQGVETILRESPSSARQILRAMKSNSLLAMLVDQDTRVQSLSVPFFGRAARTPVAAASLAVRRELPVLVAFIQRRAGGGHRITVQPPIEVVKSADIAADIHALTRLFNERIEEQIRRNPAEWVWWHRRWRRSPQPGLDLDSGEARGSSPAA